MIDLKRLADLDAETNAACGPVSHDEARAILSRFVNSHFKNPGERARASIPADPKRDDDLRLAAYIAQRRDGERDLLAAARLLAKEVRARRLLDDTPELDVDTKFGSPEQIRWGLASNAFLAARAAVESNPLANAMIEEARAATDAALATGPVCDDCGCQSPDPDTLHSASGIRICHACEARATEKAREAGRGNPIAIAAITDAAKKEPKP